MAIDSCMMEFPPSLEARNPAEMSRIASKNLQAKTYRTVLGMARPQQRRSRFGQSLVPENPLDRIKCLRAAGFYNRRITETRKIFRFSGRPHAQLVVP